MEQNTELSLKHDSNYTLKYFLRFSEWGPLEKNPEKRPRIIYLKNEYPLPQKKEYRIGYIHIERRMDNRRHSNTVFGPVHNRSVDASIHSQSPNH